MEDRNREPVLPYQEAHRIAEAVREACVRAAREGYEQASMSGLCHEGAWECAVGTIQTLDVDALLRAILAGEGATP